MDKNTVVNSSVLQKRTFTTPEGRSFAEMELAYPDFSFAPGQFVMVRICTLGVHWAYPYMVQKATPQGFVVAVHQGADLYSLDENEDVLVWGVSGRGVPLEGDITLVAEPATSFLTAPLAQAKPGCKLLLIGGKDYTPYAGETPGVELVSDASAAAEVLAKTTGTVITALNLSTLLPMMEHTPEEVQKRTLLFASTNVACGVGACKACHLHHKDLQLGIAVCCAGPYVSWDSVDLSVDHKCFQLFR